MTDLDRLFDHAIDLDVEAREAFLLALGRPDDEPRRSLAAMLAATLDDTLDGRGLLVSVAEAVPELLERSLDVHDPMVGQRLGAYRLLRQVGRGGMGEVYLAERADGQFERQVAVKVLSADHDHEIERRFLHERQVLADLRHPGIAALHDAGMTDDGRPFFVLDYVRGEPITRHAEKQGLSRDARLLLVLEVLQAIGAAHRLGIVHRDLKPSNILVTHATDGEGEPVGRPIVVDFGIAKDPGEVDTITGSVLGTPGYMAPEQAQGRTAEVDGRADVFAVGVLLYELLVGERPFEGATAAEVLVAVVESPPTPPAAHGADLPRDLESILMHCLEKEPGRRYASARALEADLEAFMDGRPIAARPVGLAARAVKAARRRPGLASAMIALAGVVTAALIAVMLLRRDAAEREALASRFAREAQAMESAATIAFLQPAHDLTETFGAIDRRIMRLERDIERFGARAGGPGWAAIGMSQWRLGRLEQAVAALERAWAAGHRAPSVALALGNALSSLYRRDLSAIRLLPEPMRSFEASRLETEHAAPARHYLSLGRADGPPEDSWVALGGPALIEARLAFCDGDLESALVLAREAQMTSGDAVDAYRLEAEAHAARSADVFWDGFDVEASRAHAAAAAAGLASAGHRARSDPRTAQALCELRAFTVHHARADPEQLAAALDTAETACSEASALVPWRPDPWLGMVAAARAGYLYTIRAGGDPRPAYDLGRRALDRAMALAPDDRRVLVEVAQYTTIDASFIADVGGGDPIEALETGAEAARRAHALKPDTGSAVLLANASIRLGIHASHAGVDVRPFFREGVERYEQVLEGDLPSTRRASLLVTYGFALNNLAQGVGRHGGDDVELYARSIVAFEESLSVVPDLQSAQTNLATALIERGGAVRHAGGDPTSDWSRAEAILRAILDRVPGENAASRTYYDLLIHRAELALVAGDDPASFLASIADLNAMLPYAHLVAEQEAIPLLIRARWALARGARVDADRLFDAARDTVDRARAEYPDKRELLEQTAAVIRHRLDAHLRGLPTDRFRALADQGLSLTETGLEQATESWRLLIHRAGIFDALARAGEGSEAVEHGVAARDLVNAAIDRFPRLEDPLIDRLGRSTDRPSTREHREP